jgi:DNA primase large subunit
MSSRYRPTAKDIARKRAINAAAIARYKETIEDIVGDKDQWPRAIKQIFYTRLRPTNRERFTMIVFFLNNGLNPVILREYFQMAYVFDADAWRQINHVITRYPSSNWTAWNISEQRST